jgi:hypothetical protein
MFQTHAVQKIKIQILYPIFFFSKIAKFVDNVGKCGRSGQVTDANVTRGMRIACWITKATSANSEYAILIAHN